MEQKTEASQAVDELLADLKKAAKLSEAVGQSRGDNRYAQDSKSVTELVKLEMSIEERIRELDRAALKAQPAPTEAMDLLCKLVRSNIGQKTKWQLSDGIGTDTAEGRAWATAIALVEGRPAPTEAAQGAQLSGNSRELAQGKDSARLDAGCDCDSPEWCKNYKRCHRQVCGFELRGTTPRPV